MRSEHSASARAGVVDGCSAACCHGYVAPRYQRRVSYPRDVCRQTAASYAVVAVYRGYLSFCGDKKNLVARVLEKPVVAPYLQASGGAHRAAVGHYPLVSVLILYGLVYFPAHCLLRAGGKEPPAVPVAAVVEAQARTVFEHRPCHALGHRLQHLHLLVCRGGYVSEHVGKGLERCVEQVQPVVRRHAPYIPCAAHLQVVYPVGVYGAARVVYRLESVERISVKSHQTVPCCEPYKSRFVLLYVGYVSLLYAAVGCEALHAAEEPGASRGADGEHQQGQ